MQCINGIGASLASALCIQKGVTAFVGGGGKTTAMLRLARELSGAGSVLVTTSTHIYPPASMQVMLSPAAADVRKALGKGEPLCIGKLEPDGKLAPAGLSYAALASMADYVLVEADGAKGMPLKAPAAHEPVLPNNASSVIAVAGLDGIGKPVSSAAFRPALYAGLLGCDLSHIVTPADVASVLCSENGQYKGVRASMRFAVLLNKADNADLLQIAYALADMLDASRVERAVITTHQEDVLC